MACNTSSVSENRKSYLVPQVLDHRQGKHFHMYNRLSRLLEIARSWSGDILSSWIENIVKACATGIVKLWPGDFLKPLLSILAVSLPAILSLPPLVFLGQTLVQVFGEKTIHEVVKRIEDQRRNNRALRRYLEYVVRENQYLSLRGSTQAQHLIDAHVLLEDIFIHPCVTADRPVHDGTRKQRQTWLDELERRPDLSLEEREILIRRLEGSESSRPEQGLTRGQHQQSIAFEDALHHLHARNSVAIILGVPGSGKSTLLRWLALQMARACLPMVPLPPPPGNALPFLAGNALPGNLQPKQIPILLHINDYARRLSSENLGFEQFFQEEIARILPDTNLPGLLLWLLGKGRCLVLLDGLDEVSSDSLRKRIVDAIYTFISTYTRERPTAKPFNRFIITSRVVGYEEGSALGRYAHYAHYTLLDFEERQIEQFLNTWCPAGERALARSKQHMEQLTTQQEQRAITTGTKQSKRLLKALRKNPGIRRLAVNPLMLTLLALIQRSGKNLPQHRIELYQDLTRSLLSNRNQRSERPAFSKAEILLAEQVLGALAFHLHSGNPILTEEEVTEITHQAMASSRSRSPDQISESAIQQFLEKLRSSGLFVKCGENLGEGLFDFTHRTFQEYFVALYLHRMSSENLKEFIVQHYTSSTWREPLLLTIVYKSEQSKSGEQRQASELIRAIKDASNDSDRILHRNLLFAVSSIADCNAWSIDKTLQHDIANSLFDLYGDTLGNGRYRQLRQGIERVALLWLQGQPLVQTSTRRGRQTNWPPLLEAWRTALCEPSLSVRQVGAVHLLATIAPDLASCPSSVLSALIPPLLQLARLSDFDLPYPPEISVQLLQLKAQAASPRVEDFAFVALRLLDVAGPARWLRDAWLTWQKERPDLLQRLAQHTLELNYLVTPAALPGKSISPNWTAQFQVVKRWQQQGQRNPDELQIQLLEECEIARYPHAYLLKQMLNRELNSSPADASWQIIWDTVLREEMARGRSATYQPCLALRLLLCRGNGEHQQKIANELMVALSIPQQQNQALITITNIYQQELHDLRDFRSLRDLRDLRYQRDLLDLHSLCHLLDLLDVRYLRYLQSTSHARHLFSMLGILDLRVLRDLRDLHYPLYQRYRGYLRDMLNLLDRTDLPDLRDMLDLRKMLDREQIVDSLCKILEERACSSCSAVLFALYSLLATYNSIPSSLTQQVQESIERFEQQKKQQPMPKEHCLLITAIKRRLHDPVFSIAVPALPSREETEGTDAQAMILCELKQQHLFTKQQVEVILAAVIDTRALSEEKQKKAGAETVQQLAWKLLAQQQVALEADALPVVLKALDDGNPLVCATGVLLLQRCKNLPQDVRREAAQKIMRILPEDALPRHPLDPPDEKVWRLDDVLFETLRVVAE
jgi:hypothetical protein